jgi:hypothetical protein
MCQGILYGERKVMPTINSIGSPSQNIISRIVQNNARHLSSANAAGGTNSKPYPYLVAALTRDSRGSLRASTAPLNQHWSETSLRFDCGFSRDAWNQRRGGRLLPRLVHMTIFLSTCWNMRKPLPRRKPDRNGCDVCGPSHTDRTHQQRKEQNAKGASVNPSYSI